MKEIGKCNQCGWWVKEEDGEVCTNKKFYDGIYMAHDKETLLFTDKNFGCFYWKKKKK